MEDKQISKSTIIIFAAVIILAVVGLILWLSNKSSKFSCEMKLTPNSEYDIINVISSTEKDKVNIKQSLSYKGSEDVDSAQVKSFLESVIKVGIEDVYGIKPTVSVEGNKYTVEYSLTLEEYSVGLEKTKSIKEIRKELESSGYKCK